MNTTRLFGQSLRSLRRQPLRTVFIMCGSVVGVAALTLTLSMGRTLEAKMVTMFRRMVGDASMLVIAGGGRMMGSPRADAARLTVDDMLAVVQEVDGIVEWDPQAVLNGTTVQRGTASVTTRVLGSSERWSRVWERGVAEGESFASADVTSAARVAIIGRSVARDLFGDGDPIGSDVQVGAVPVRVIGVLEEFGTDLHGMDRDNEIVMPLTTVMRRLNNLDAISGAKLLVDVPERGEEIAEQVAASLRRQHRLVAEQDDDFRIMTALAAQRIVENSRTTLTLYVPLGATIILVLGGVITAALMLGAVNERLREIGLRRAVGARPEDVHRQFLVETAITTVVGGFIGLGVAALGARAIGARIEADGQLTWTAIATGLGAAVLTGWLAGVLPARRAATLNPVDALR
ncbi:MAG: ABC transporter permease [Gemmatimonadaceae bacterium]